MTLNVIQMKDQISELIDRVKSARYPDIQYMNAINRAIEMTINDRIAPIRVKRTYSFQTFQRIRDELYTLIPAPATGTTSSGLVPFPANYYTYILLWQTISGVKQYCRPMTYNEEGPLADNPFKRPSAVKPYFNEYASGFRVLHNSEGSMGDYELWYIKKPDLVSMGYDRDKVTSGTLTNSTVYYVENDILLSAAISGKTIYYVGETVTGDGVAALSSGTLIPASAITNCNLPGNLHQEIIERAAANMVGATDQYQKKQMLDMDAEKA